MNDHLPPQPGEAWWHERLVGGWTDDVRKAVVELVAELTVGWWGSLVRTVADPDGAPSEWTEALHRVVLTAITSETGADLEELGGHAAWACYDEVWGELTSEWADGGRIEVVPLGREPVVVQLLQGLPPQAAAAAGADVRGPLPDPLWIHGRLRVDVKGLGDYLARVSEQQLSDAHRLRAEMVVAHAKGERG